ncbi:MAG: B3/4 domain-containing protein [Deltaproteobacteria bacterium]
MNIIINEIISKNFPELFLGLIHADVKNSTTSDDLWDELLFESEIINRKYKIEEINKRHEISSTRQAYKKLGKDPNRYRPSSEALCRRIARGIPIYRLNTLVDIINIVSIRTGYSIGAFDLEKIHGNLILDAGRIDDEFEAIGRGILNIEGLPVYRDQTGPIGTPTSDCERTKITLQTSKILIIFNAYSGEPGLKDALDYCINLLKKYSNAHNIDAHFYSINSVIPKAFL